MELSDFENFKKVVLSEIKVLELQIVGDVFYNFPQGGFTAVICLTESHISIHTWPEYKFATADVFLSNFNHNNDEKARKIANRILEFYDAFNKKIKEVRR